MEKDILNYSPTVMFRGTPCIFYIELTICLRFLIVDHFYKFQKSLKQELKIVFGKIIIIFI